MLALKLVRVIFIKCVGIYWLKKFKGFFSGPKFQKSLNVYHQSVYKTQIKVNTLYMFKISTALYVVVWCF